MTSQEPRESRCSTMLLDSNSRCRVSIFLPIGAMLAIALTGGCGGGAVKRPTGKVAGKVTLADKPLTKGRIAFGSSTAGTGASAELSADGTYVINSIPTGDYKVFITPRGLGDTPPPAPGEPPPPDELRDVPPKFRSETLTDLKATIKEGDNTADFALKP